MYDLLHMFTKEIAKVLIAEPEVVIDWADGKTSTAPYDSDDPILSVAIAIIKKLKEELDELRKSRS